MSNAHNTPLTNNLTTKVILNLTEIPKPPTPTEININSHDAIDIYAQSDHTTLEYNDENQTKSLTPSSKHTTDNLSLQDIQHIIQYANNATDHAPTFNNTTLAKYIDDHYIL